MPKCVVNRVLKRHVFAIIKSLVKKGEGEENTKNQCVIFHPEWQTSFQGLQEKVGVSRPRKKNNRRTETALVLQVYTMLLLWDQNHSRSGKKGERKDTSPL